MDPFPFEQSATTKTHAQKLVDEVQEKQPEVLVLAMRAPPRGAKDIVVLGSTFGRHGKKADADDLKILTASEPATGVYSNGKRFGVDHFAADVKGNRLCLAGEEKGTLEVFDLKSGKHLKTVKGLEEPHAIHFMPDHNRLIVSDSGDGLTKVLDAKTFAVVDTLKLTPGADVMSYDPSSKSLWTVTGGKT